MTFEWPLLLLSLALVPILILFYVLAQRRRRQYALRFTNLALLGSVVGRGPGIRRHIPPLLYAFGVTALLASLARPQAVVAVPRDQSTVILVMDVSGSMRAEDLQPNRMVAAQAAAESFVEVLPDNMQVGLVSFSSAATVNAAPTTDHAVVKQAIARLRADGGTAIGDGLNMALDQLEQRPTDAEGKQAPAMVVLMSDGQSQRGSSPDEAAARAQASGITVHTVGIGQRDQTVLVDGRIPVILDETTLLAMAETTGGQYFYAAEQKELADIYTSIGSQISWVEERTEITALFSALGTVFVVIGGLLSLRWLQRLP